MDEGTLLSPEDVKKRREKKVEATVSVIKPNDKFFNRGGTVAINYETMGRFNIPATLYFRDFSVTEENDLLLVAKEDLLETSIVILNKMKNEDANCLVEDMLIEEFFETLIGIKKQFDTVNHNHLWICDCQNGLDDPKVNESVVNLNTLQYSSILEADTLLKDYYKNKFDTLTDEQFQNYIITRYKDNPNIELATITREQEIEKIQVKEPFQLKFNDHVYSFRFSRIGDLVKARKIAKDKFAEQIKRVQNKKISTNTILPAIQVNNKKEEIEKIKAEELKFSYLAVQALSLISVDGKELNDEEKIKVFSEIPRNAKAKIKEFIGQFKIGIQHEQEFVCPLCGKTDKRWIQREIDYDELLPLHAVTHGNDRISTGLDIFVGI